MEFAAVVELAARSKSFSGVFCLSPSGEVSFWLGGRLTISSGGQEEVVISSSVLGDLSIIPPGSEDLVIKPMGWKDELVTIPAEVWAATHICAAAFKRSSLRLV